ncbi:MAG: YdbL family protein [Lentisphaeria bacterium]
MKKLLVALCLFYFCCPIFVPVLQAKDAQTIKQDMMNRLPRINELKKQGKIGENHNGFLALVQKNLGAADQAFLEAENADRKAVYEAIAKQQGTSSELVGQLRAKKIYEHANSGEFLMKEDGSWAQK